MKIAPSTYYEARSRPVSPRVVREERLREQIRRVHHAHYGVYGARKVWLQLRREGIDVARCTVERLMRELGLSGAHRGKRKRTTIPDPQAARATDLVKRQFDPPAPNTLWVADFTYVSTWSGWVYVAFVIDAYSRRIVGWRCSTSMTTPLVLDAIEHAIWSRAHEGITDLGGLIHHNDRGSQGGFNWSSQHLNLEVFDGSSSASSGSSFASEVEVARASEVPARSRDRILGGDREGSPRGGGGRCHRRGASGCNTVVPSRWRNAHFRSEAAQRPVSLVS